MRRKLLFVITTFVLSLITTSQALAQDSRWTGTTLEAIAAGGQGKFYLYNVGKKMFLSQGGLWGTGTEVSASGLQMQALEKVSTNSSMYYVKTNLQMEGVNTGTAGYLNFADGKNITNDTGNFFLDQGPFTCGRWTITAVSENVYTLKVKITEGTKYKGNTYYLSAESSSMNVVPTESGNDEYSQWMFVTLTEIKADFLKADDASISNPTPSSFFFSDPGFYRKDLGITNWTITSSQKELSTGMTDKVALSSEGNKVSFSNNITPSNAVSNNKLQYTYYIGNGYILDGSDGTNLDKDLNESVDNWQSPYGKDWTANIHGQSGIIQQTISSNTAGWTPGWYKVICKGFSTDGKGKLFAYSGTTRPNTENDKYHTATFITPE